MAKNQVGKWENCLVKFPVNPFLGLVLKTEKVKNQNWLTDPSVLVCYQFQNLFSTKHHVNDTQLQTLLKICKIVIVLQKERGGSWFWRKIHIAVYIFSNLCWLCRFGGGGTFFMCCGSQWAKKRKKVQIRDAALF